MITLPLSDLNEIGFDVLGSDDLRFSGVSIDTRTIESGNLFFALTGPNFDGHDYCQQAIEKGASAVVVERQIALTIPQVVVSNTREALQQLAAHWRKQFAIPVVAITGSSGKTTVKEMVSSILALEGNNLSTKGNLNNELGVPLTLLRLDESFDSAVIEIGANHVGEIAKIVDYVAPDVSVITMIGPSHLEGFGSLEAIVKAKSEIFRGLDASGVAVINRDDVFFDEMKENAGENVISFGLRDDADVTGVHAKDGFIVSLEDTSFQVQLQLMGEHNRRNALAAVAVSQALDLPISSICEGLRTVEAVSGRLKLRSDVASYRLIDDTYNANPASMRAGIDAIKTTSDVTCLVLGDMAELGEDSAESHRLLGVYAKAAGIDYVFAVGRYAEHVVRGFSNHNGVLANSMSELFALFKERVPEGACVLVKGSRSSGMDKFIDLLLEESSTVSDITEEVLAP